MRENGEGGLRIGWGGVDVGEKAETRCLSGGAEEVRVGGE